MLIYQNVYINQTQNLWKFGKDTTLQTWILVNYLWKFCRKRNKSNVTCSYIWHVNKSECTYWLDTHTVKVCWRYLLPNTNVVNFCYVVFRHCVDLAKKSAKNQKSGLAVYSIHSWFLQKIKKKYWNFLYNWHMELGDLKRISQRVKYWQMLQYLKID